MRPLFFPAITALFFPVLIMCGCKTSMPLKRVADLPPGVAGVWQSNGYGYVFDASEDYARLFHYTPEFCIEDEEEAAVLGYYLVHENLTYDTSGKAFYFSPPFEPYKIELKAISKRPQTCGLAVSDNPVTVFESFTSYMKTHYAFFDLYHVDWDRAVASARESVTPKMSDAELFSVLTNLMSPLKDGHLELRANIAGKEKKFEPGKSTLGYALKRMAKRDGLSKRELNNKMMRQYWITDIKRNVLGGNGEMVANDVIQYGVTSGGIGYMAITMEADFSDQGLGFEADDLTVLKKVLDDAISLFNQKSAKSVIIDLSVNFGGYDFIAREIAGRFASQRTLAYTKYAADSANKQPFPVFIEPSAGPRFTGPVIVVTSNVTVSAGEMLTMSLRALPNVVHVGEATRGAHSDVLTKKLPNGWSLDLSNEVYQDHKGEFWEGRGIPPHVQLQIFDLENPLEGHAKAIETVIKEIDAATLTRAGN